MSVMVRLDKCQAIYGGNITSVQHAGTMDNGSFVNLGALISGQTDVYATATPATASLATEEALLVYTPELNYEPGKTLVDFTNVANTPARVYHLTVGDIITITDDGITGTTVVGEYVIPADGSFELAASASLGSTRLAGKVIEKGTFGYSGSTYAKTASTTFRIVKA
jgi:hypothetical protein